MNAPARLLITEDEMVVALDLERRLKKLGYAVCGMVSSGEDAVRQAILLRPDLVLMDICLAGAIDGIEAARQICQTLDVPVIYLTANADDTTLRRAQVTHPSSYLLKPFRERELQICIEMGLLNHRLQRELREAHAGLEQRVRERTAELVAANAALRGEMDARAEAERLIREQAALLDKARDAIYAQLLDGSIVYWNRSAEGLYGIPAATALAQPADRLLPAKRISGGADPSRETRIRGEWVGEIVRSSRAGGELIVESRWTLVRDERGEPSSFLVVETDVTERKTMEAQFLRAQRLESIGALASGIAHDLNNVFTPLIMSAQSLAEAAPGSLNAQLGEIILSSSQRGADMVKQILLFVRGAAGERVPLRAEHLVKEVQKLLRETLPRSIRLQMRHAPDLRAVVADATQLHQLLMNLCVNARDAMPGGGELTIELHNVSSGQDSFLRRQPSAAGDYVRLSVTDTGTGMPAEILAKIFTPFFTTKEPGKGTGLGLSTVQVLVRDHHGFLDVESVVGRGTRFIVYLPACDEVEPELAPGDDELPGGNGEWILVADDEACVREITKATLEAYGYRVAVAHDGVDALAQFAQRKGEFSCVVSDVSMPYLDGLGFVHGARRISADTPMLLMSGTEPQATLAAEAQIDFLPKPFTKAQLLLALHRSLHRTTGYASSLPFEGARLSRIDPVKSRESRVPSRN